MIRDVEKLRIFVGFSDWTSVAWRIKMLACLNEKDKGYRYPKRASFCLKVLPREPRRQFGLWTLEICV